MLPPGIVHPLLRACDWQDRPEFSQLCDWWQKGGAGVCALVGIGGAGKTAIPERFLRILPSALPALSDASKAEMLAPSGGLFVFSFYDATNPDSFFAELHSWLSGTTPDDVTKMPSYQQTLRLLETQGRSPTSPIPGAILLILDGFERIQDDGARGGAFGQILDGRLRDLTLRASDGWLSGVIASHYDSLSAVRSVGEAHRLLPPDRYRPTAARGCPRPFARFTIRKSKTQSRY